MANRLGIWVGREEATGIGVITVLSSYLEMTGISYRHMKMAIQGMGAVGFHAAIAATKKGILVTRFSDERIAVIKEDGWSQEQLEKIRGELKRLHINWWQFYQQDLRKPVEERVFAIPGVSAILNEEPRLINGEANPVYTEKEKEILNTIIGADVDILLPAFLGNQITESNWDLVRAKYIAEGANHPLDQFARTELTKNGHIILSGILSNAGGVYGSYLQMFQSLNGKPYTLEEVQRMSQNILSQTTQQVIDVLKENPDMSFDEACEYLAWKNAARERLKIVIDQNHAHMDKIQAYYGGKSDHLTVMWRINALGLMTYYNNALANYGNLSLEASNGNPDNAMAAVNGGIDLDASHMLIDQKGQADFQTQIKSSTSLEWQAAEGLQVIFLGLQPINVPELMGFK